MTAIKTPFYKRGWFIVLAVLVVWFAMSEANRWAKLQNLSPAEKRDRQAAGLLSAPGGASPALIKHVQDRMNDPESFQHVQTLYVDRGEFLQVSMKYRGKNAFGGTVTESVQAKVWFPDGRVSDVQKK